MKDNNQYRQRLSFCCCCEASFIVVEAAAIVVCSLESEDDDTAPLNDDLDGWNDHAKNAGDDDADEDDNNIMTRRVSDLLVGRVCHGTYINIINNSGVVWWVTVFLPFYIRAW